MIVGNQQEPQSIRYHRILRTHPLALLEGKEVYETLGDGFGWIAAHTVFVCAFTSIQEIIKLIVCDVILICYLTVFKLVLNETM
tara:strand:+ start:2167 stop:2418 length:252 start_codon:yes stop_codon:yes gene_type:complete